MRRLLVALLPLVTTVASADVGRTVRLGYRTLRLDEAALPSGTTAQRFHVAAFELYPRHAANWRIGLASQLGMESGRRDWLATEGLLFGLKLDVAACTAFVEGALEGGLVRRSFRARDGGTEDSVTMMGAIALDAGVELPVWEEAALVVAVGVQHSRYLVRGGFEGASGPGGTGLVLRVGIAY